jgi:hypothetical protein
MRRYGAAQPVFAITPRPTSLLKSISLGVLRHMRFRHINYDQYWQQPEVQNSYHLLLKFCRLRIIKCCRLIIIFISWPENVFSDGGWSLLATPENMTGYGTISFQYAETVLSNGQLQCLLIWDPLNQKSFTHCCSPQQTGTLITEASSNASISHAVMGEYSASVGVSHNIKHIVRGLH